MNEDFHVKIFEIMQNFLYVYCSYQKSHLKSVIKAILIIITAQMINDNNSYDKTVSSNFVDTKIEFLNQFLIIVHDFSSGQLNMKKIIFKIFKYLYFIYQYACGDIDKALRNDEDIQKSKKFEVGYRIKNNLKINIKKFFEKTKYDHYILQEMSDEASYLKLLPFILLLDESNILKSLSDSLSSNLDSLRNTNFRYEVSGREMDLSNEERRNELKEYVYNKEINYYKQIEEYQAFINSLKNYKLNIIEEESSRIYEEEENIFEEEKPKANKVRKISDDVESDSKSKHNNNYLVITRDRMKNTKDNTKNLYKESEEEEKKGQKRKVSKSPQPMKKRKK
jgi:hypothetical protein